LKACWNTSSTGARASAQPSTAAKGRCGGDTPGAPSAAFGTGITCDSTPESAAKSAAKVRFPTSNRSRAALAPTGAGPLDSLSLSNR